MRKNILICTGDGKGKSTAAFGMALRAVGHRQQVLIVQFLKQDESAGELGPLRQLGIRIVQTGRGFVPAAESPEFAKHRQAAQDGFKLACRELQGEGYQLVILDEICGAVAKGLLAEADVIAALEQAPAQNIVLTGRNASAGLIALADTVTEMVPRKHAFEQGIGAREGIEF